MRSRNAGKPIDYPQECKPKHETHFDIILITGESERFTCLSGVVEVFYSRICIYGYLNHEDVDKRLLLVLRDGDGIKLIK